MKRHWYIASLAVLVCMFVVAPRAGAADADAGRESPFALGAGARALSMGGGLTSFTNDGGSLYYNPAGLGNLTYQQVGFQHSVLFQSSMYDVVTWAYPINENHGIGLGFMRLGTGGIVRRVDYAHRGEFDYSQSQLMFGYGRNLGEPVNVGMTLKIVNQAIDDLSDFAVGADLGLQVRLANHLSIGAVARDLVPADLQLDSTSERTPLSFMGGLSWHDVPISEYLKFTASLDVEKIEDREIKLHGGGEVVLHDSYSFRVGYDRDNVAFGAGLRHGRLHIDYAYKMVDYVEDLHHFSLSLMIGKSVQEQIRLRELARRPPEPTAEEKRFTALIDTANYYMHRFRLDSASAYFRLALEMEPEDQEIIGSLAAIEEMRRVQREQAEKLDSAEFDLRQTINNFLNQAELMFARRMYSASLEMLDLIFESDPDNPWAQRLQEQIHEARQREIVMRLEEGRQAERDKKLVEAIEAYNRVLEIDPGNTEAGPARSRVLATMGLPEKIRLGIELYEQGEYRDARRQFQDILKVNPNEPVALDYMQRIETPPVRTSTLEDIERDPETWTLYLDGLRYMRNKEYQKAIDNWQRVLDKFPNNPNTLNNIEQARLRLKTEQPNE